ncbi:hypothetical protein HR45_06815 [Shewanella mangrovi]|uniref:Flagellar biosynthesis protein FlgN n=1 Tax=Shewanella mangrovi TaxID=1515746 RepID=A0A094JJI0_9GAMM|nr:flagellar export chaperone FlgN [Shewanella mangrovi]KFZ38204.1 hypothetical protein HR45_06815 [Shewanella mangrovi]
MSKQINDLKSFFGSMRHDVSRLDELIKQFEQQYELLSSRDNLHLPDLNSDMLALLNNLRESNVEREQYLKQLGLPGNKDGLQALQAKLPSPMREKIGELISELSLKVQTCNMMNERSGKLLSVQRKVMTQFGALKDQQAYPDFRA